MKRLTLSLHSFIAVLSPLRTHRTGRSFVVRARPASSKDPQDPSNGTPRSQKTCVGKLKIPGLAHSSPVVWGNKVFVSHRRHQRRER